MHGRRCIEHRWSCFFGADLVLQIETCLLDSSYSSQLGSRAIILDSRVDHKNQEPDRPCFRGACPIAFGFPRTPLVRLVSMVTVPSSSRSSNRRHQSMTAQAVEP